jgi:hypothetical protein
MQDYAYFSAIGQQMNNGGREAMLHDLLARDISAVNLSVYPRTEALLDQIISSLPPVGKYVYEQLQSGMLGKYDNEWGPVQTRYMYEGYQEFCQQTGVRFKMAPQEFGKQLKRYLPEIQKRKMTIKEGYDNGERILHYVLPSLEECREQFERQVRMKIDWDE